MFDVPDFPKMLDAEMLKIPPSEGEAERIKLERDLQELQRKIGKILGEKRDKDQDYRRLVQAASDTEDRKKRESLSTEASGLFSQSQALDGVIQVLREKEASVQDEIKRLEIADTTPIKILIKGFQEDEQEAISQIAKFLLQRITAYEMAVKTFADDYNTGLSKFDIELFSKIRLPKELDPYIP